MKRFANWLSGWLVILFTPEVIFFLIIAISILIANLIYDSIVTGR